MRSLALVLCLVAVGCGSGNGGGGGTGGTGGGGQGGGGGGGTGGSGGGGTGGSGGGGGGTMVAVTGSVTTSGNGGGAPTGISGATVTLAGTQTTATTAADGSFSIMAPAGSNSFFIASLSGYESAEVGFVVPATGGALTRGITLLTTAELSAATMNLSPALTIDPTKGEVVVQFREASGSGTAGYSATLSASHGNSFDPGSGTYTTMTQGSSGNDNPLVFPNVTTGTTTVTVTPATGKTCTADQAITNWRVDANVFTFVQYNCQ